MASIMIVVAIAQVIARYVLQSSLSWSEELIRYLNIWVTMVGSAYGLKYGYFATITLFSDYLKKKSKVADKVVNIVQVILSIFFYSLLTYFGFKFAFSNMEQLSPTLRIPIGVVNMAMPIGGILGIFFALQTGYSAIVGGEKNEPC